MFASLLYLVGWVINAFRSRQDLMLENLALRQQLLALHGKRPGRRLSTRHKLYWEILRRLWSGWKTPLVLVTPRTPHFAVPGRTEWPSVGWEAAREIAGSGNHLE